MKVNPFEHVAREMRPGQEIFENLLEELSNMEIRGTDAERLRRHTERCVRLFRDFDVSLQACAAAFEQIVQPLPGEGHESNENHERNQFGESEQ